MVRRALCPPQKKGSNWLVHGCYFLFALCGDLLLDYKETSGAASSLTDQDVLVYAILC